MADSQCANPAYALEVEEMILEYLLYTTTKAHLHDFRSRVRPANEGLGRNADGAATLVRVFDQFLELFKANHPEYDFSPDTNLSIKLLQFVVLFTHRRSSEALSPSSRDQLKLSSKQNSVIRMKWWDTRRSSGGERSQEDRIIESWRHFFVNPARTENEQKAASPRNLHAQGANFMPLFELLPHCLDLSADMAATLGQDVTEQWMVLAAEFMLQSAWEKHVYLDAESDEEPLKVAFAWGHWGRGELENALLTADASSEAKNSEERVDAMFRGENKSLEDAVGQESPSWSDIKHEYLSAFGAPPTGREGAYQVRRWQIQRLKEIAERFPMNAFEDKILDYLEGLWKLRRKPLLVQIEQGKIEGLTEEDFKVFMTNVFPKGSGTQEIGQGGKWWD